MGLNNEMFSLLFLSVNYSYTHFLSLTTYYLPGTVVHMGKTEETAVTA